jgi:hypothetical protein
MSNLRLINETTVSSTVSSVNIENVFTDDFDIYKITSNGFELTSNGGANIDLRLINSSGSVISTNYALAILNLKSWTSFSDGNRSTNNNRVQFYFGRAGASGETTSSVGYIFNPTNSSSYTFGVFQNFYDNNNILPEGSKGILALTQTNSITGFQAFSSTTFNEGVIRTYGLRVDS